MFIAEFRGDYLPDGGKRNLSDINFEELLNTWGNFNAEIYISRVKNIFVYMGREI